MADNSQIEWTDATWNPTVGCDKISPGCAHCYAEVMAKRLQSMRKPGYEGVVDDKGRWTGRVNLVEQRLEQPLTWKRPRKIFVDSMSDLFHERVPISYIARVFATMFEAQWHTFQVLTKRADRMHAILNRPDFVDGVAEAAWQALCKRSPEKAAILSPENIRDDLEMCWPLDNAWLGVSVEDQHQADLRLPYLVMTPAVRRVVSAEPLLGPVDLSKYLHMVNRHDLEQYSAGEATAERARRLRYAVHWVIVGGESGPGARPMDPDWARSLRDQCNAMAVPFFFKQWGGANKKVAGRMLDGLEWNEMPKVCT